MNKIKELCMKFNRFWDAIPEPKRFIYFVIAAAFWSWALLLEPFVAIFIAAIALYIRFQRYDT
jgi:hypothetical protein